MNTVLAIYRDARFSPNSVAKDKAIMDAVASLLEHAGYAVLRKEEHRLLPSDTADLVLTMGRLPSTTAILAELEKTGARVINAPSGLKACSRSNVDMLMRSHGVPCAPLTGKQGYWIKRGDEAAQHEGDVVFAADEAGKDAEVSAMMRRGVTDISVTAHVEGDLVKFYGVRRTGFFMTFYPSDDGDFKFGTERINGKAGHYAFDKSRLKAHADSLAALVGIDIYGGDCIVRTDGTYAIIDFNDWPSFSRCRTGAAKAIAALVFKQI